jgi:hypothetical protein
MIFCNTPPVHSFALLFSSSISYLRRNTKAKDTSSAILVTPSMIGSPNFPKKHLTDRPKKTFCQAKHFSASLVDPQPSQKIDHYLCNRQRQDNSSDAMRLEDPPTPKKSTKKKKVSASPVSSIISLQASSTEQPPQQQQQQQSTSVESTACCIPCVAFVVPILDAGVDNCVCIVRAGGGCVARVGVGVLAVTLHQ